MPADEIEMAIAGAEAKRRELEQQQPAAKQSAMILSMLPRAAALYGGRSRSGSMATREPRGVEV